MALDASERDGVVVGTESLNAGGVLLERQRRALPHAPRLGNFELLGLVLARQTAVERRDHVPALLGRDHALIGFERVGIDGTRAVLIEPIDFSASEQENAAKDEASHALRVRLRVSDGERRTPRPAKQLPALDLQQTAQFLHVGHKMPGRVVLKARIRRRPPRPALIEQNDPVMLGIVKAAHGRIGTPAGAAMKEHDGFA